MKRTIISKEQKQLVSEYRTRCEWRQTLCGQNTDFRNGLKNGYGLSKGNAMSRYVIWTSDENLEVFVGFDEGMEGFFLTIADVRTCTGEAGSYLFHNLDHHYAPQMNLDEVETVLIRFGLFLPPELATRLASEGHVVMRVADSQNLRNTPTFKVLGWQSAD